MSGKLPPADPATLDPNAFISRNDVENLMAERIKEDGESDEKVRARISENLDHAVNKAKRRKLPAPESKGWRIGVIGAYLRKAHPGKFEDWPADRCLIGALDATWFSYPPDNQPLPNDLATCHEEIRQLRRLISHLKYENAELRHRLERQGQVKAETSRKHSVAGQKARGVPKRRGN